MKFCHSQYLRSKNGFRKKLAAIKACISSVRNWLLLSVYQFRKELAAIKMRIIRKSSKISRNLYAKSLDPILL